MGIGLRGDFEEREKEEGIEGITKLIDGGSYCTDSGPEADRRYLSFLGECIGDLALTDPRQDSQCGDSIRENSTGVRLLRNIAVRYRGRA